MVKIKELFVKYREIISYVFFGVLTTLVNWLSYIAIVAVLGGGEEESAVVIATAAAQILAILFAYVTNRLWVFRSKAAGFKGVLLEMFRFFAARGVSFVVDIILMYVGVSLLNVGDSLMKILSNVVIIIINYVLSKVFVFKRGKS